MERTLSQEERIRRAEELYYRRQNAVNMGRTATVNVNPKKNYKLLKKVILQILACVGIYALIYNLQSNSDNFSIDSINYVKSTIAYDANFNKIFDDVKNYFSNLYTIKENTNEGEKNVLPEETLAVSESNIEEVDITEEVNEENVDIVDEEASSISQIDEDAQYIKDNFSLIKPVTGTITSRFGLRNPTTPTVPTYHTGIDIAVPEGTVFVSAMDGTVELVSSQGDYRKSCKNNKWRCKHTVCTL